MSNALLLIDTWETLRGWVLEQYPAGAAELSMQGDAEWRETPARDRGALCLICALELGAVTPALRRHARQLLVQFEEHGLLDPPDQANHVAENPLPQFADLDEALAAKAAQDLRWVISERFVTELGAVSGPVGAIRLMNKNSQLLRGVRGARFLVAAGYPMAVPDRAKRRWLNRFGLLEQVKETAANREEALRLLEEAAHQSGTALLEMNHILTLFTGGGALDSKEAALCGSKPKCAGCPLASVCQYGLFRQQHGELEVSGVERRRLEDSFLPEDRPREKLKANGPGVLTNAELLAILLRTGTGKEHAVELANRLLRDAGSIDRLAKYSLTEMTRLSGIGEVKAITIQAALELARRIGEQRADAPEIRAARDVFQLLRNHFLERRKEQFHCLLLNTKNRMVRRVMVSEGTLNQSLVHPREAFQEAIRDSASAVVFVHNHPSGDPQPSRADDQITHRLVEAGRMIGIRVMDHVIIGRDEYYSYADEGKLEPGR